MKNQSHNRLNLAAEELATLSPNLIEAHMASFNELMEEGITEIFDEVNPITDYTGESWELRFEDLEWGEDNMDMMTALKLGLSFDRPLYVNTKLINKKTGEIKKQKLFVSDVPMMSHLGTFAINGHERVVVMQIVRAEGVLFFESKQTGAKSPLYAVKLMPLRGRWFDFEVNKHGVMSVKLVDKRPRILLTTLLRALGYSSDSDIRRAIGKIDIKDVDFLENTLKKDITTNTDEALLEIYRKLRPEDSVNIENAKEFLESIFFNKRRFYLGKIGRYQLNTKLGIKKKITSEDYVLHKEDLVHIVRAVIELNTGLKEVDDIDTLANRRIRGVGELIGERIRMGVLRMEKNIRDRMSTYGPEDLVTPSLLVNTKPVIAAINQFFGSSPVSRYMDQENILSELETKRRITAGGPRGLTKERATFSVRDVHSSHYSKLCPVATPEGPSIGIVSHMAIYARINEYGFLEAPYYRILSNVDLNDEKLNQELLIGAVMRADAKDADGKVIVKKGAKLSKADLSKLEKAGVTQFKVDPQVTDDVVYLNADEERRFRIGPASIHSEGEIAFEKNDKVFVRVQGGYRKVPVSELDFVDINPGQIAGLGLSLVPFGFNDDPTRTLMASNMQRQAVPLLKPRSPIVGTGFEEVVAKASGRTIYAEQDGTVLESDAGAVTVQYKDKSKQRFDLVRFHKTNQNTSFSQTLRVVKGQNFKAGEILIDGPSTEMGELALGVNLTAAYMVYEGYNYEDAIIISERLVKDDVLTSVHVKEYVQDIRETKLGNEQITRDIPNVGEFALRNLDEEGIVRVGAAVESQDILVGIIAPKGETELTAEEKLLRAIFGEYARDVRDNSLRMPHGDKGIVIAVQVLDKSKGDKLNPGVLKQVKVWVARTSKISVGDKLTGIHGDKGVISKILPEEEMPYMEDGTPIDIILSPMFVKRMNLGQIREMETAAFAKKLGIKVTVPPFAKLDMEKLTKLAKEQGVDYEPKVTLYDGRTGMPFDQKVLVGPRYYLKLNHLASDKLHARSTGSYTMVTQQPLGGKAQFGGQRFGEMEVWALEAHGAVHNLQEMLTIKSDDVVGRASAYKSIIQGIPFEAPNIPESFKVFISEMRALGMSLELIGKDADDKDDAELVEGVVEDMEENAPVETEAELSGEEEVEIKDSPDESNEATDEEDLEAVEEATEEEEPKTAA
ncbi:MAG: DNA-directed RNA polymerase subunit beta [candidate division WS6 bacterium OLB20]|uniref:DNA-directed RNA polymerase subunit beta n=1 Tax=candidate division WS6 bacterium OLB20 TaxID=1617426 RepID=A0A136LZF5_9BACT|nr:MAG: DNA-directed RNA polymerase subunit beta [candidate division WS6 bacterium OLB20]